MAKLRDRVQKKGAGNSSFELHPNLGTACGPFGSALAAAGRRVEWLRVGGMLAMMLKVDVEIGRFYSSGHAAEL